MPNRGSNQWSYWMEVRKGAFKPQDRLDWVQYAIAFGVFGWGLWFRFGGRIAVDELTKNVIGIGGGIIALCVVGVFRLARSAYRLHSENLDNIAKIEKQRDDARAEVSLLEESTAVKQADVAKSRRIVEALLPRVEYAINELAYKNNSKHPRDAWKVNMREWEHQTKMELEKLGCTPLEIHRFWAHTEADLATTAPGDLRPGFEFYAKRGQWVQFRINALRRIIDHHSRLAGIE
jgi:hypothetical protein